jgi:hypothetical protein
MAVTIKIMSIWYVTPCSLILGLFCESAWGYILPNRSYLLISRYPGYLKYVLFFNPVKRKAVRQFETRRIDIMSVDYL